MIAVQSHLCIQYFLGHGRHIWSTYREIYRPGRPHGHISMRDANLTKWGARCTFHSRGFPGAQIQELKFPPLMSVTDKVSAFLVILCNTARLLLIASLHRRIHPTFLCVDWFVHLPCMTCLLLRSLRLDLPLLGHMPELVISFVTFQWDQTTYHAASC